MSMSTARTGAAKLVPPKLIDLFVVPAKLNLQLLWLLRVCSSPSMRVTTVTASAGALTADRRAIGPPRSWQRGEDFLVVRGRQHLEAPVDLSKHGARVPVIRTRLNTRKSTLKQR